MKLYETLEQQLKKEPNFVTDNGELKKWVVINKAQNFDEELIGLLLDNADLKEKFFVNVKNTLVFNQNLFVQFLEQKNYLNDSYTQYKNKVGLTIDSKYLKQRNEVALVWPFKDCILEGGQSREEDKREEIFFNEILAQDEITQLLEPKVLTNAKRIDKDGEHPLCHSERSEESLFNRNENGTITDNLIIKGNNLLALHSLKKEFAGKVKLIYIDPPYNTGNDGFKYNDSFNHSTWMTFMKNRLEVARHLLREDGVIFVQCDDNEQAYLKILLDDVFNRDNFIANMVRIAKTGGGHDSQFLAVEYDYVILFAKNKTKLILNKMIVDTEKDYKYKFKDEYFEKRGKYYLRDLDYIGSYSESLDYPIKIGQKEIYAGGKFGRPNTWRWSKKKFEWGLKNGFIVIDEIKEKVYIKQYQYVDNEDNLRVRKVPYRALVNSINSEGSKEITNIFNEKVFNFPKPESFIKYLFDFSTQDNDIVLDFHLGSGTTAAVAHKMNRQYIGIEQMDYIETVAVERLKKVIGKKVPIQKYEPINQELALVSEPSSEYYKIEYDQGGISKTVNWQGGGSFVYLELKKYNETFIEQIAEAQDTETLLHIWEQMKAKSFFKYSVDLQKFQESLEEFKQWELKKQKEILCELLDKNQLYVNISSLNDADFACTAEEKKVTKDFYQIKK